MKSVEQRIEEMLIREAKEFECSIEEVKESLIEEWGSYKGYGIFLSDILELEHIERIDDLDVYDDDFEAAEQAEKDGVELIPFELNPKTYPYNCYRFIDTEENRKALEEIKKEENLLDEEIELEM